jgi:hypothetical protein
LQYIETSNGKLESKLQENLMTIEGPMGVFIAMERALLIVDGLC